MKTLTTLLVSSAMAAGGYLSWPKSAKPQTSAADTTAVVEVPAVETAAAEEPIHPYGHEPLPNILAEIADVPTLTAEATAATESATSAEGEAIVFEEIELITAVEQGMLQAVIRGNGRERLATQVRNNSPTPLRVTVPAGQVFENGRNLVIAMRATTLEVLPAQTAELKLSTAALLSTNKVTEAPYRLSYQYISRVRPLITWLADHPELPAPAVQTAVLALMENLPVHAVAKFAPSNGITSKVNTDAFRVETGDLMAALTALRACGARVESLALATDSQLKLELMIEPLSREAAKRFYGISEENEWDFWKHELLQGDPSTRHYALFGIARFYPEIALEMLPNWVREAKTHPVYRMSAIQAIADTQKPEALAILHHLAAELGAETELGKAATQAAEFLDQRLSQLVESPVVAFRGKPTTTGL